MQKKSGKNLKSMGIRIKMTDIQVYNNDITAAEKHRTLDVLHKNISANFQTWNYVGTKMSAIREYIISHNTGIER